MLIAVSAVLLALGLLAYRRQLSARDGLLLFALRLAVLAALALVLVGSVLGWHWKERPRHVVMLADQSMSVTATGLDTVVQRVVDRFPLPDWAVRRVWVFGDSALPVADEGQGAGDEVRGARTRIGRAIELASSTRPAAIVLVSDGQDNGETDSRSAAARAGVAVYAVGVGAGARRNVAVTGLVLPAALRAGESATVTVRLGAAGFAGEPARVRLGGQERTALLDAGPSESEAAFRVVFDRPGRARLTANVEVLVGETDSADNEWTEVVDVGGGSLTVGLIALHPGPESRFIAQSLVLDSSIDLRRLSTPESSRPRWLDSARVLVLDNPEEDARTSALLQDVARRVERGAGLFILAGPSMAAGPGLERLLGATPARTGLGPEPIQLTPAGRLLPWFAEGAGGVRLDSVPPFAGFRPLESVAAGAEEWVQTVSGKTVISTRKYGSGRVVYVAGYPLWRWGFTAAVLPGRSSPLETFLTGVTAYLAESDSERFRLVPDRAAFLYGEPARLTLRAIAPGGRPWSGLDVIVEVAADSNGAVVRVPMTETADGVYEAAAAGLEPGAYSATAEVGLGGERLGRTDASFAVVGQSLEMSRTGRDRALLEDIARAAGGMYFDAESLPGPQFEARRATFRRGIRFDPRRSVWLFVLAALAAGLEWALRRRKGLL
ncbi:MAG: vWA domain-containing protein [bacterium]